MRIVFLGPAAVHLQSWLPALRQAGIDLSLITCHDRGDFTADVPVLELTSRLPTKLNLIWQIPAIRNAVTATNPDLLVAYYASSYGLVASLMGRPYVVVTAGSDVNIAEVKRPYLAPLVRRALGKAAAVVCWSHNLKASVMRFGVSADRVFVMPRGIDVERFSSLTTTRSATDRMRLICVRRFRKIFHHGTLIEACRLLKERGVDFELMLCGEGSERAEIERRVQDGDLTGRVKVLGQFRHSEVADRMRSADIYIALPEVDGASASLFEAMSAGLYPIVSDIPANRQWITNDVNGSLVPYDDPNAVADAVQRVVDPSTRQPAIAQNLSFARRHLDIRVNTQMFVDFFVRIATDASR